VRTSIRFIVALLALAALPHAAGAQPATTGPGTIVIVNVTISDTSVKLSRTSFTQVAGIAFRLKNVGKKVHDFEVGGQARRVAPAHVEHMLVSFTERGYYRYQVHVNGTRAMRGLLHVAEGNAE
jgi:hypothetical protein